MPQYEVRITPAVLKSLERINRRDRERILEKVKALAVNPWPSGVKKLSDEDGVYRVRSGDYRILYKADGEKLIVFIIRIGNRREVYR